MVRPEKFLLIVGNSRSGSTILGAVLDAHPQMVVANETIESTHLWRGLDGDRILEGIFQNAEQQAFDATRAQVSGQKSKWTPSTKRAIRVVGDKVWNPATLLLHGKHDLIPSLEERVGAPVVVIHACRNPFDAISTMHLKSGAPISDRIRWYSMHCEAVAALCERLPPDRLLHVQHENLIQSTVASLEDCCRFLDVPCSQEYLDRCEPMLFESPRETRHQVSWSPEDFRRVKALIQSFSWLQSYRAE